MNQSAECVGQENMGSWKDRTLSSNGEAPGPANDVSTLVLAANRTKRPDILSKFHKYRGGWDIANKHYWTVSSLSHCLLDFVCVWGLIFLLIACVCVNFSDMVDILPLARTWCVLMKFT